MMVNLAAFFFEHMVSFFGFAFSEMNTLQNINRQIVLGSRKAT